MTKREEINAMRKTLTTGVALAAITVSACAPSDPMSCSSENASDALRDMVQRNVVTPAVEEARKKTQDTIARFEHYAEWRVPVERGPEGERVHDLGLDSNQYIHNMNVFASDQIVFQCVKEDLTFSASSPRHTQVVREQEQCIRATLISAAASLKEALGKIDANPVTFEALNIITTDKTDYKASCKATMHWSGEMDGRCSQRTMISSSSQ
jgi:hypothetical protein